MVDLTRSHRFTSTFVCRVCVVSLVAAAWLAGGRLASAQDQPTYRDWISTYQRPLGEGWFYGGRGRKDVAEPILLQITAITGDEPIPDNLSKQERFNRSMRIVTAGNQVSATGLVMSFSHSSFSTKGGSGAALTPDELASLKAELERLPDDHERLPPPGRKLVIQWMTGGELQVRVYDRAAMADQVRKVLRLSHTGIRSHVLSFGPERQWTAFDGHNPAVISVLADGRLVTASEHTSSLIKVWDPATGELLHSSELPKAEMSPGIESARQQALPHVQTVAVYQLIPLPGDPWAVIESRGELRVIDTRDWKSLRTPENPLISGNFARHSLSQFVSNGKEFLYQDGKITPRLYDAATWKLIDASDRLREGLLYAIPSEAGTRTIHAYDNNSIELRDVAGARTIALLDDRARLRHAAYSPDGSLVALATQHLRSDPATEKYWPVCRIRVWNVTDGKLLHEYRPFEQDHCESVESLLWSHDGKYLLATTKSDAFFTPRAVSIWNVAEGRHRGKLAGFSGKTTGAAWLPDGRLVAGGSDGKVCIWDVKAAFAEIEAFEATLPETD